MRLLLIRHGQTPANVEGRLATAAPGPGLTDLGREQAEALPEALAGEGIEALFVSTLVRTHLTAAPLAASLGLDPVEIGGLREIEAGDLEDRADAEAYQGYVGPLYRWAGGDLDARLPGGPSGSEFLARYDAAVAQIAASGVAVAAAFSHGAAIRCWATARGGNLDQAFLETHELGNTGVVTLEGSPDAGWHVVSWADEAIGGGDLVEHESNDPTGRA